MVLIVYCFTGILLSEVVFLLEVLVYRVFTRVLVEVMRYMFLYHSRRVGYITVVVSQEVCLGFILAFHSVGDSSRKVVLFHACYTRVEDMSRFLYLEIDLPGRGLMRFNCYEACRQSTRR